MATLYAWSPILYDRGENGEPIMLAPGEKVTKDKLNVSDEQLQDMIEAGSVREMPYPNMPEGHTGSPIDFMRRQAEEAGLATEVSTGLFEPAPEVQLAERVEETKRDNKADSK